MAASVRLYQYFVLDREGRAPVQGGSLSEARSISLGDVEVIDRDFAVAASGIVKIFDAVEDESLGDADFIWLETDLGVLIQFTADPGDDDNFFVLDLAGSGTAGQMGPALVLGSDLAQESDGTIDVFDGTENTIGEIWAKNAGTESARVRLVVAT